MGDSEMVCILNQTDVNDGEMAWMMMEEEEKEVLWAPKSAFALTRTMFTRRRSFLPLPRTTRLFSTSKIIRMKIIPVPVREDNYAYLLVDDTTNKAAAIDPYDVPKVKAAAEQAGVHIVAAIATHHHFDHSGGNQVSLPFIQLTP